MKTTMHVTPWDRKDLRREVARIVGSFREKKGAVHPVKAEKMTPTMHVTPWDRKALRQEVARIVRGF